MGKNKSNRKFWIISFIVMLAVLGYFATQLTVVDIENNKLVDWDTTRTSGSVQRTDNFLFDDYKVVVRSIGEADTFSGCDEINNQYHVDTEVYDYDEYGCPLYRYHKYGYKCETSGRCDDYCDLSTIVGGYKQGDYCDGRKSNYDTYCRKYCDYERRYVYPDWSYEGGAEFSNEIDGCFWYYDVYYQGNKIYTFKGDGSDYVAPWQKTSNGVYLSRDGVVVESTDDRAFYYTRIGGYATSDGGKVCEGVHGYAKLYLEPEQFNFLAYFPTENIYVGDTTPVNIELTQNVAPFYGTMKVLYEIETQIGTIEQLDEYDIVINEGRNTYSFEIPTIQTTDKLYVTPIVEVHYDTSAWTHNTQYDVERESLVATITGDRTEVSIRPTAERDLIRLEGEVIGLEKQLELLYASQQEKAQLIEDITSELDKQGQIIAQLNQSATENAELIQEMTNNIEEQAILIENLQASAQENAQIIADMDLTIAEQQQLIDSLTSTQQEKDIYIAQLLTNLKGQDAKILELSKKIDVNAQQIAQMDATIEEQLQTIDSLNINIAEKQAIIVDLVSTVDSQQEKIDILQALTEQLGDDYAQAKDTILQLESELDVADDRLDFMKLTIEGLELDATQTQDLLNSYQATIQEDALLINSLQLDNEELRTIVSGYREDLVKEQELVAELQLDNDQLTLILNDYENKLIEQQEITSQLNVSNTQLNSLIARYKENLITEQQIVTELNITNNELLGLIAEYDERLVAMADYIDQLEKSNEEVTLLLDELNAVNEYQKELLAQMKAEQTFSFVEFDYKWFVIGGLVIVILIVLIMIKKQGLGGKGKGSSKGYKKPYTGGRGRRPKYKAKSRR